MGAFLLGLLPKFVADFLVGIFKDWRRDKALEAKGELKQELKQEKATVEVIARNAEGQDKVDTMTEKELDEFLGRP